MKLFFLIMTGVGLLLIVIALLNKFEKPNRPDQMLVHRGMSDEQVHDQLNKKTINPSHRLGLRMGIWFFVIGTLGFVLMWLI